MPTPLYIVDAFAERAFAGNPAAVCLLEAPRDPEWMQLVAREMNLSETAFVVTQDDGFGLRWFTPGVEVALCGHATLATAHVLWERGAEQASLVFHTQSGALTAQRRGTKIELDFPALAPSSCQEPEGLAAALGVKPVSVHRSRFDYLVELADESAVRAAVPDFEGLGRVEARGVMITALSASTDADFVSRFFAPRAGVREDPVTGSAHCVLAPFWSARIGRTELVGQQLSEREGRVEVSLRGESVGLRGSAVTVLRGELLG